MVLMAAMMYAAAPSTWGNVATVKLIDGNNDTYQSRFGSSPELTDEAGWGAVPTNLDGATVRAYVQLGATKYEQLFLKSMVNVPLIIKTYNSASMTIKLTGNEGSVVLYDKQEDEKTTVAKGETKDYVCTVAANSTISDRFILFYAPTDPSICFNYEKLQISGYAGATVEVLNYADKSSVFAETVASDNEEINLQTKGLTANTKYFVKLKKVTGEEKEYVITYKANAQPVTPAP